MNKLTEDYQLSDVQIKGTQVLVCTLEKWDMVARRSDERLNTQQVKLIIFVSSLVFCCQINLRRNECWPRRQLEFHFDEAMLLEDQGEIEYA